MTETRVAREGLSLGAVKDLERRVEQLNKRARKLGVTQLRVELSDVHIHKTLDPVSLLERLREVQDVVVIGETPKLAGWSLVAVLDHDGPETVTARVPGTEAIGLSAYRNAKAHCDHCGTTRKRLETFVLIQEANSRLTQVGRNCVADFLGGVSPAHILWLAGWMREISGADFEERSGGHAEPVLLPINYLVATASCIRAGGWLSRTKAREEGGGHATADEAWELCFPPHLKDEDWKKWAAARVPSAADEELAAAALAWAQELDADSENEYLANLGRLARKGWVKGRDSGLMASAVATFNRERVRAAERAAEVPSTHLGTVGERLKKVAFKVLGRTYHESQWGSTALVKLVTPEGSKLKWWTASGGPESLLTDGESYTADLTVKAHDEWKGQPETTVTRVSVWTPEALAITAAKEAAKAAKASARAAKAARTGNISTPDPV
jgi:hypothetical protein